MNLTERIAEYVNNTGLEDFPPDAIDAAKAAITDCLGCTLAGSIEPLADILCNYIADLGGKPAATVIGRRFKTSSLEAALVNGAYVSRPRLRRCHLYNQDPPQRGPDSGRAALGRRSRLHG